MTVEDLQSGQPQSFYRLSRVGIRGVRKPVTVRRGARVVSLMPIVSVAVNLPAEQRGSHLSRNAEAIHQLVDETVREPVGGIEEVSATLVARLLKLHEYADEAEVELESDYFLEREFDGRQSLEHYRLQARSLGFRDDGFRNYVGVEVVGLTACPCAMENTRHISDHAPAEGPFVTHNQRNRVTLTLEIPDGHTVEADDLIDICETALSSPTFDILKRWGEARLVLAAHERPRFVEDVVRELIRGVLGRYAAFPDTTEVVASSESEESIHKHNAFATRVATLGELRVPHGKL